MSEHAPFEVEYRVVWRDGSVHWLASRGLFLDDAQDNPQRMLGIVMDITSQRQAEKHMDNLRAQLAHMARVQTVGEMAAGLAQRLNQPLTAIVTRAEVAAEKLRRGEQLSGEQLGKTLDFLAKEGCRAGQIVRRIREFVRKTGPEKAVVVLAHVIDEIVPLVESDLRHAGIRLSVEVAESLPKVRADRVQLQQVILNLIRNAWEAMQEIDFNPHQLAIRGTVSGSSVEISVRDTGCGVSDEHVGKLFAAFHSTKQEGMGLGLAICRSIIEAHGGRIRAARNAERGMTFAFTLPIAGEEQDYGM